MNQERVSKSFARWRSEGSAREAYYCGKDGDNLNGFAICRERSRRCVPQTKRSARANR
jgi:hypothetical protein